MPAQVPTNTKERVHSPPLPVRNTKSKQVRTHGQSLGPRSPPTPPTGPGDLRLPHHLLPRRCGGTLVVHSHRALSISSHLACRAAKAASDRSSICKRAPLWTPLSARKSRLSGGRSVLEAAHRLPPPPHTRLFLVRTRIQCSLHLTPIGLEVSAVYVLF